MLIRFALQHMLRHWRMNLVLLAGFILTAVFLAALPAYATAIAGRGLRQQLDDASASARNIRVDGEGLNAPLYGRLQELLPTLIRDRIEVREGQSLDGVSAIYGADGVERPFDEFLALSAWNFSELSQHVTVREGRLPDHIGAVPNQFYTELEAVIGQTAATQANFSVGMGSQLTISNLQVGDELRSADEGLRVKIVGIVEPNDPSSDVWNDDLTPFGVSRASLFGPNQPDTIFVSLLIPTPTIEQDWLGYDYYWRVLVDTDQINVNTLEAVQQDLSQAESELPIQMDTALLTIIEQFQAQVETARVTLFLLSAQSLIFVLFTLALIGSFVLDQSRGELASLAGRGFTSRQMTQIFAIQGFLLAVFVAAPVGPFLTQLALGVWGKATNTAVPQTLTSDSWILALIAVLFGWLTLVLSIWSGTRSNILHWQRQLARPARWTSWQRYYLDFFLLILGGLIYWQLADTGTLVAQTVTSDNLNAAGLADPILLLGPSLLLIAIALMFLRIFPYLLQLAAWWSRRGSGLILPYGFTKLSRDPTAPSRVLLLISLAGGLILFATLFRHSLAVRQTQMAHYLSGADVRLGMPIGTRAVDVGDLPGIEATSLVYRNVRVRLANNLGRQAELLAIEPESFTAVSEYAPFTSRVTIDEIMPVLEATEAGVIPAVFSANAHPLNKHIGDRIKYVVGTDRVEFEVRGITGNFPSVDAPFIITNRAALEAVLDVTVLSEPWVGQKEIWLSVQPEQQTALVNQIEAQLGPAGSWLLSDAQALERQMQGDLLAQEVLGAFNLNGLTLAGLSVVIFLLVHFFSAQRRLREFSLMRATGLSARQLLGLLSLEGVIMMVLGLAAGTGIGWGLAVVMRPFLSRTLTTAVGHNAIYEIVVNWTAVTGLYTLLIAAYAVALILLLAILLRVGIHRAMQMGEE